MALVPFSVSGAAGSQDLEERLMQVGPYSLLLHQRPGASGNTAHLTGGGRSTQQDRAADQHAASVPSHAQQPDLSHVGLVLWQSGYVLADFLLLRLPAAGGALGSSRGGGVASGSSGSWAGVRVLELGCGGGTVGMFLALAGAQVVLTDQEHILSLTRENLALNFPATAASSSSRPQHAEATGSIAAAMSEAVASVPPDSDVQQQQPLSAAAAFAAAFGSPAGSSQAAPASPQPQCCALEVQQVFAAGPLAVEYSWGEPLQQLQHRVASSAAARLGCEGRAVLSPPAGGSSSVAQAAGLGFDVVVGADLLYDTSAHSALLHSLQQLAAASPHLQVYMCWRDRVLGEAAFLEAAAAAGWVIEEVPASMLHPEFRTGHYKLIALTRLP